MSAVAPGRPDQAEQHRLNVWDAAWPLLPDECPCDVHFVEWLRSRGVEGRAIFHFGTGEHHLVGIENAKLAQPNQILGITASRQEYDRYIDLIVGAPALANSYKAMFADIYTLDARILPPFDVVTLFHLCEFYDPQRSAYARFDDAGLLAMFADTLRKDGRICFYLGSNGRLGMLDIADSFVRAGRLEIDEVFRALLICRVPARAPDRASRDRDHARLQALRDA